MLIDVRSLRACGGLPSDRKSCKAALLRSGVTIVRRHGNGGYRDCVRLSDLPSEVRLAWHIREAERHSLEPGTFDPTAHDAYLDAHQSAREAAERKAHWLAFCGAFPPR